MHLTPLNNEQSFVSEIFAWRRTKAIDRRVFGEEGSNACEISRHHLRPGRMKVLTSKVLVGHRQALPQIFIWQFWTVNKIRLSALYDKENPTR